MKHITDYILESKTNKTFYFEIPNINITDKKILDDIKTLDRTDVYINGNGPCDFIAVSKQGAENLLKIIQKYLNTDSVKDVIEMHAGFEDALRGHGDPIDAVIPNIVLDDQLDVKHIDDLKNLADTTVAVHNDNGTIYTTFFVKDIEKVNDFVIPEIINHTTKSFASEEELFDEYPELQKYAD